MTDAPARLGWQTRAALIVALATLVALAVFLAGERGGRMRVHAYVDSAVGVHEGSLVSYLGVDVGRVERIAFANGRVLVTLDLDSRSGAPLRRGDTVQLALAGAFGDRVVRIAPGPATARAVREGDTLVGLVPSGPADGARKP